MTATHDTTSKSLHTVTPAKSLKRKVDEYVQDTPTPKSNKRTKKKRKGNQGSSSQPDLGQSNTSNGTETKACGIDINKIHHAANKSTHEKTIYEKLEDGTGTRTSLTEPVHHISQQTEANPVLHANVMKDNKQDSGESTLAVSEASSELFFYSIT
jgi:hypothetical protein